MKKILMLFLCFGIFTVQAQKTSTNAPQITFEKTILDYGKILKGSSGSRFFEFTNTGKSPLEFKSVEGSCGCTVPKMPTEAILPGEKSKLEVTYDTKRLGRFSKSVTIVTNASKEPLVLRIKGEVYE